MKIAKFFPVSILIIAITMAVIMTVVFMMAGGAGWSSAAQQIQPKAVSANTPSQTSTSDKLEQYFQEARQNLAKNATEASIQIRKAVAQINEDADHATGKAKQLLLASSKELDGLADQVQKGAVKAEQELNNAFSRAHNAYLLSLRSLRRLPLPAYVLPGSTRNQDRNPASTTAAHRRFA